MKTNIMTKLILGFIFSTLFAAALYATELRSLGELGMDASAISIGQIPSYGTNSLSLLNSPINTPKNSHTISLFYDQLMNSEITHYAIATSFILDANFRIGVGVANESISGIDQTASRNNQFVAPTQLQYLQQEFVTNLIYSLNSELEFGSSLHLVNRDNFGVKGSTLGLSLGAKYDTKQWGVTLSGNDLNSPVVTYTGGAKETLSARWVSAIRFSLPELPIDTFAQLTWIQTSGQLLKNAGTRFWITDGFSLSAGYMEIRNVTNKIQGTLALGAGLNIYPLSLDYAFNTSDYIEQTAQHKVTLSFLF